MELIRPVHIAMNVHSEMETVVYKKKCKEFSQFRLILPIKKYYIHDFENFLI